MSIEIRLNGGREVRVPPANKVEAAIFADMAASAEKGVPVKLTLDAEAGVLVIRMEGR